MNSARLLKISALDSWKVWIVTISSYKLRWANGRNENKNQLLVLVQQAELVIFRPFFKQLWILLGCQKSWSLTSKIWRQKNISFGDIIILHHVHMPQLFLLIDIAETTPLSSNLTKCLQKERITWNIQKSMQGHIGLGVCRFPGYRYCSSKSHCSLENSRPSPNLTKCFQKE